MYTRTHILLWYHWGKGMSDTWCVCVVCMCGVYMCGVYMFCFRLEVQFTVHALMHSLSSPKRIPSTLTDD